MSPFLDYLDLIRVRVEVYHNARICGDWKLDFEQQDRCCFHMASQGDFTMDVPGFGQWRLSEGDLVIFPRELPHAMAGTDTGLGPQTHLPIAQAQNEPGVSMLCGKIQFHHNARDQILDALPPVYVIKRNDTGIWLENMLQLILQESLTHRGDMNVIMNRLCELMISYAIRHFIDSGGCPRGILSLYADNHVARAIRAMHQAPEKDWTIESLAVEAAMSRTRFAERFRHLSGWTPMQYLTWWRMQLALRELENGSKVMEVASLVGYQSEAAFSRAFKRVFDFGPGAVRAK